MFAAASPAMACGPYNPIIPTPEFFSSTPNIKTKQNLEKQENLRLWQLLTSKAIPLKDIEDVVYRDSPDELYNIYCSIYRPKPNKGNLFYTFLDNKNDNEIVSFLYHAKCLERARAKINSPWYYPTSKEEAGICDLRREINYFKRYKGKRLRDRYALQTVRALFASRQYGKCVEYYDSAFAVFPHSNLFKKMAMDYVAGCWARLGDTGKANRYFAATGNFSSLMTDNPAAYMAENNPDAIELLQYLQDCSSDSAALCSLKPIAEKVIKSRKAKCRGDWEFALAYIAGEYHNDYRTASRHIRKGLRSSFSSESLRNHAVAYRMKCDAANGVSAGLLSDLKWFEKKINLLAFDAKEWNRMLQNIVYIHWVPRLWKKKDYSTAILLCGYADNLLCSQQYYSQWEWYSLNDNPSPNVGYSYSQSNTNDYGCLSFQMMGSLQSSELIKVARQIKANTPLYKQLKKYARTDRDYIYELIGTIALREENYKRAMAYLSKVSDRYQKTLNVYCYLQRDPFSVYPNRKESDRYNNVVEQPKMAFASKMYRYQQTMKNGKTNDERGLARLRYAIGRRNSFEQCWALTQYWRGCAGLFYPEIYEDYERVGGYEFLYNYVNSKKYEETEKLYQSECKKAMAMLRSDMAKAEAEYLFHNVRTVIKLYPDTPTARLIKTHCDRWRLWL